MDYCYAAEFLLEGVSVDKELKKDEFVIVPDASSKNKALLKYSFSMPTLSEIEAEEKAKKDVNKFLSFLFLGINGGIGGSAFSTKFIEIKCTNLFELFDTGQPTPTFHQVHYPITYGINETALKVVTDSFKKYSPVIAENYWVSLEFWRTGLSKEEEYLRFEEIWKAFEIFYRDIVGPQKIKFEAARNWISAILTHDNMKEFVNHFSKIEDNEIGFKAKLQKCSSPLECLIKENFTSSDGVINYSQNMDAAIQAEEYKEALANVILCIAKLRNNIFHANIFSDKERPLVFVAGSLLSDILNTAFHNKLP